MKTYIQRSYELGVACARADKALGNQVDLINGATMLPGGTHADKTKCGRTFVAGYNTQVLRHLDIPTRAHYRTIVKTTEKFWRT